MVSRHVARQLMVDSDLNLGRKHRPDYWIMVWGLILITIGVVLLYSISPALTETNHVKNNYYLYRQLIAIFLSFIGFYATYKIPLSVWRSYYKPLLIAGILATLIAYAMPVNPAYPAHRWVRLGGFSFQSVELVKFAGLVWFSGFLAKRVKEGTITNLKKTLRPMLLVLLGVGVIIVGIQSDLGSAGVIIAMMFTMAYVAGLPLKKIGIVAAIVLIGLILAVVSTPYRLQRIEAYLHPQTNCQGSGYQACQALIAVGSGGFMGLGLGNGAQAYGYLPESDNDSIFAIYAEKFGFIGSTILILIFAAFFTRIKNVAEGISDDFSKFLVLGVLTWLSVQALINMGAMVGLLPLKGITLPFISYGGTSMVFTTAAVGFVFQASQYTKYKPKQIIHSTVNDRSKKTNYSRLGRVNY